MSAAYGVEAGLRYFNPTIVEPRVKGIAEDFRGALPRVNARATMPVHREVE